VTAEFGHNGVVNGGPRPREGVTGRRKEENQRMKELGKARGLVAIGAISLLVAACGGGTATTAPSTAPVSQAPASQAPASEAPGSEAPSQAAGSWKIGYSNAGGVGNGFREEQVCTARAEALASGQVASLNVIHQNGTAEEQLQQLRTLIAADVDAIVFNPNDPDALVPALDEAKAAGIKTVSVDAFVNHPDTYNLYNNQVNYAYLGAKWLFEQMGGKGNVYYSRGFAGHPADTDRDTGFKQALTEYPDIKVLPTADGEHTGWDPAKATENINNWISSGQYDDTQGIWTSGMDSMVVDAIKASGKPYVPIVGADLGAFVTQLLDETNYPGLKGAAVTNTAAVGGAGVNLAIKLLNGETIQTDASAPKPNTVLLVPVVAENVTAEGKALLESWQSVPGLNETWPLGITIEGWTTYTPEQAIACKGPGD
jgi:ribose transport system substrate-binding protein